MKRRRVEDVMTKDVVTVSADTLFAEIVAALSEHRISAVPVTDMDGRVIGVVTETDLLRKEERHDRVGEPESLLGRIRQREEIAKAGAVDARGLMTVPAVVASPTTSIPQAARMMAKHRINQLPVVRDDGRLAGMVARSDLLRVFLRSDDEIRDEIIREVLVHGLWQDPAQVHVRVNEGVVGVWGRIELKSLIPVAVRLIAAVEGVVDVVEELDYDRDDTVPAAYPRA